MLRHRIRLTGTRIHQGGPSARPALTVKVMVTMALFSPAVSGRSHWPASAVVPPPWARSRSWSVACPYAD
jgi:hypothetical protein